MTRYPPHSPPAGGESYPYEQQYGGGASTYNTYNSEENQTYGQEPHGHQQQQYNSYGSSGPAFSYDGPNDRPYQPYSQDNFVASSESTSAYGQAPSSHTQPPAYGQQYQDQSYSAYGSNQQYPYYPPQQSHGNDVDAFRSHFEQPHGAIDPSQPHAEGGGDRGLVGALSGGALGALAGHKMHHGVIGAIGGAAAGSMLEDAYKKHEKKEERIPSNSSNDHYYQQQQQQPQGGFSGCGSQGMAGNFHASARDVRLEGTCTLVADCADMRGNHRQARLDLNDCLVNSNGRLLWQRGGGFAASARNIHLVENGRVLEAELGDGRGGWVGNRVVLDERVSNEDGRLVML